MDDRAQPLLIPVYTGEFLSAHWSGGLKEGQGAIPPYTGVLRETPYGLKSRFEDGPSTNPVRLIGAARAGCYSMALSLGLGDAGLAVDSIDTKAMVKLDEHGDGFFITDVHVTCKAKVSEQKR